MNIVSIVVGIGAFIGVTWVADKFVFKKESDPKQIAFNAVIFAVILGISAMITSKTAGGKGLLQVSETIANK